MPILASRSSHGLRSSEETPDSLELLCKQPATEVFFDEGTGEIFADYEKYLEHFALKSRPLWMCRYTGKSGLTYSEALDSETQISFSTVPKFASNLFTVVAFDSLETIASKVVEFGKSHYMIGEHVRIDINADVRYWGDVLVANYSVRSDGSDSSEYKVSLAAEPHGAIIGEASFVGIPPFHRLKTIPSRNMIKKFAKSSASRSLFTGSPWILHEDLAQKYGILKELPPDLANAAAAARIKLMGSREMSFEVPSPIERAVSKKGDVLIPDEEITPDFPANWPAPKPFQGPLSESGLVGDCIFIWAFCQAFSAYLKLSPFSLQNFMDALVYDDIPNPILEAIHLSLVGPILKERRLNGKLALASILRRLRLPKILSLPAKSRTVDKELASEPASGPIVDIECDYPNEDDDLSTLTMIIDPLVKLKWFDLPSSASWWSLIFGFLADLATTSESKDLMIFVASLGKIDQSISKQMAKGYLCLSLRKRVEILMFLVKFNECLSGLRIASDESLEKSLEAKKDRRHFEAERNKLIRDITELEKELSSMSAQDGLDPKEIKRLESTLKKMSSDDASISRRIEGLMKEEAKCGVVRIASLGQDRQFSRYWWLDGHITTQNGQQGATGLLLIETSINGWKFYDNLGEVERLIESLNSRGIREVRLKSVLKNRFDRLSLVIPKTTPIGTNSNDENETALTPGAGKAMDIDDEEEVIVVAPKKRGRRPRIQSDQSENTPAFLAYRNTLGRK